MVKIRLSRGGAKRNPFYYITVADSRFKRDGRYIEKLGFYNPSAVGKEEKLRLSLDRIEYWKSKGAKLSDRVAKIISICQKQNG